jgi:hypothetical protein
MATTAGVSRPLRRLSDTIADPKLRAVIVELEVKVTELDQRLFDAERRLKAGGL